MSWYGQISLGLMVCLLPSCAPAAGQDGVPCRDDPAYRLLDFWVGEWDVLVRGVKVGRNRIEKLLDGCALLEIWTDTRGREGRGFFYREPVAGQWRQVWVTDDANRVGQVKEKRQVPVETAGAVRFEGQIPTDRGDKYLDRTTLVPRADGRVHQLIEISTDEGESWSPVFDAMYEPLHGPNIEIRWPGHGNIAPSEPAHNHLLTFSLVSQDEWCQSTRSSAPASVVRFESAAGRSD